MNCSPHLASMVVACLTHISPARRSAALFALALLSPLTAAAQVFQLQGGSSSLFHAHGGSVEIQGSNYEGWVGAGSLDQPRFGAFFRTRVRDYMLSFGDDAIRFEMPTDVFDQSHYFFGRGIGMGKAGEHAKFFGFLGATSSDFAAPFFRAASADRAVGLFFMDTQLNPTLRAFSRNVISSHQTSVNGLEWQPRPSLRTALAGGLGSNQGYFASSLTAEKDWMTLKASYVRAEDRFRRIIVETPLSSETDRENILLTLRPKPFVSFAVGRQNLLLPPGRGGGSLRATVNQFRGAADAAGFTFSGSFFDSRFQGRRNTGNSFSVGREIAGRMDVRASVFMSRPAQGPRSTTWLASLRELISPRLSLLQLITQSNGQTTVSFGGSLLTNRVSIGAEYQTLYIPFQSANQFKQVLVLNVRLHPFGNVQLNAGTYVAPDGAVKYTAYGSTFVYHGAMVGGSPASFSLPKYSVRGRVIDEDGYPVRGAALRLDGEVAYTDSRGHFFVRKRKAGPFRLQVLVNEFVVPGRYQVISAPTEVQAAPENRVADITIVLRRTAVRSIQALQDHSPDALDQ